MTAALLKKPGTSDITADYIATDLGVSRSFAYELIRQMRPLQVGRLIRVSRENYEQWKEERAEEAWRNGVQMVSSSAVQSGGGGDAYSPAPHLSGRRPSAGTGKQRASSRPSGSEWPRILPVTPRVKPRSAKP